MSANFNGSELSKECHLCYTYANMIFLVFIGTTSLKTFTMFYDLHFVF